MSLRTMKFRQRSVRLHLTGTPILRQAWSPWIPAMPQFSKLPRPVRPNQSARINGVTYSNESILPVSAVALRRGRKNEALILSASLVSTLGSGLLTIANALIISQSMGTAKAVGTLFILIALPQAFFSVLFGKLSDVFDRKKNLHHHQPD